MLLSFLPFFSLMAGALNISTAHAGLFILRKAWDKMYICMHLKTSRYDHFTVSISYIIHTSYIIDSLYESHISHKFWLNISLILYCSLCTLIMLWFIPIIHYIIFLCCILLRLTWWLSFSMRIIKNLSHPLATLQLDAATCNCWARIGFLNNMGLNCSRCWNPAVNIWHAW